MEVRDKVAIVTGASDDIGEATAKKLAAAGAKVVLAARTEEKLAKLSHELPGSVAVRTDMGNPADILNLIDRAIEIDGTIDIFVNNAGVGMYSSLEDVSMDDYRHIMNVNLFGPVYAMKLVIPRMREQGGGMILNISSRVSKNYIPNLAAYASTKYALNAVSLTARAELAKDNIVVSVMYPKITATSFGKSAYGFHPNYTARPQSSPVPVDTADDVADKIIELIVSEAPEAEM